MATFDDVVTARNKAYDNIWSIAQGALTDLKASTWNTTSPALQEVSNLHFDSGLPTPITLKAGGTDLPSIISKIDTYINKLANVTVPTFPDAPNFKMEDHQIWNDPFADKIKQSLSDYVTSMGIPDKVYQDAIFNEDFERNLVILNDLYDLADAKTGAKGFTYTNDYGNSLKLDAQVKYQYDRTQLSRTISKTVTEWARQNFQFAIEKGIVLEQAHMDFTYKYCTAFVSIYKDMVTAVLERYKAQIAFITEPIDALVKEMAAVTDYVKTNAEIDKTNEVLKQSRSDVQIKEALQKYSSDVALLNTQFQQQMEQVRASAQHAAGLASASTASVIGFTKK